MYPVRVGYRVGLVVLPAWTVRYPADTALLSLLPPRPFINGGEVCVHVSGIAAPAGHFLAAAETPLMRPRSL